VSVRGATEKEGEPFERFENRKSYCRQVGRNGDPEKKGLRKRPGVILLKPEPLRTPQAKRWSGKAQLKKKRNEKERSVE